MRFLVISTHQIIVFCTCYFYRIWVVSIKTEFNSSFFHHKWISKLLYGIQLNEIQVHIQIFSFKFKSPILNVSRIQFHKSNSFINSVDVNNSSVIKTFYVTTKSVSLVVTRSKKSSRKSKCKKSFHLIMSFCWV